MNITTKIIKTYYLEEHEARLVMTCLDYCAHRLATEKNTGLHKAKIRQKQLEELRLALRQYIQTP